MSFRFQERRLASHLVKSVWRAQSDDPGVYISVAADHWSFLFAKRKGKTHVDVCGPETRATLGTISVDSDVYGINFRPGAYLPHLLPGGLVDARVALPNANNGAFWLGDTAYPFPTFDELEMFAHRLARTGQLVHDTVIGAALRGEPLGFSPRALQYRFLHTTGLTRKTIQQIQRAQRAALLLKEGVSIADTVHCLGYSDQAHLTRSLRRLYGQTPTTITPVKASLTPG